MMAEPAGGSRTVQDAEDNLRADLNEELENDDDDESDSPEEESNNEQTNNGSQSLEEPKPRSRRKPPKIGEIKRRKTDDEESGGSPPSQSPSSAAGPSRLQMEVDPNQSPSGQEQENKMDFIEADSSEEEEEILNNLNNQDLSQNSGEASMTLRQRRPHQVSHNNETIPTNNENGGGGGSAALNSDGVFEEAIERLAEETKRYQQRSFVGEDVENQPPTASTSSRHSSVAIPGGSRRVQEYYTSRTFDSIPPPKDSQDKGNEESEMSGGVKIGDGESLPWTRKIFRSTFDYVFPGFAQGAAFNNTTKMDSLDYPVAMRPANFRFSTPLQCLLRAEALYFVLWAASFVYTYKVRVGVLKELHGNLVLCMAALFSVINVPRLLMGLKASVNERLEMLALFWMMTFIVQLPLFGFILFTDIFTSVSLPFTIIMDGLVMVFIVLELGFSSRHLQVMVSSELTMLNLARKSVEQESGKEKRNKTNSKVPDGEDNSAKEGKSNPAYEHLEDDSNSEVTDEDDIEYSMRIQQLPRRNEPEQPERDDSNQVSSTSDSLNQRPPIKVL